MRCRVLRMNDRWSIPRNTFAGHCFHIGPCSLSIISVKRRQAINDQSQGSCPNDSRDQHIALWRIHAPLEVDSRHRILFAL